MDINQVSKVIRRIAATASSERLIKQSGLFDSGWYAALYPDVADSELDPINHYIAHGAAERRAPSPVFDTGFYLQQYPDLDPAAVNPLCHYLVIGEPAGAWPNRYFDPVFVRSHLGSAPSDRSLLSTYLDLGPTRISPSANFDAAAYLDAHPMVETAGISPLSHILAHEWTDTNWVTRSIDMLAAKDLVITHHNNLAPIARQGSVVYFHVSGNDPNMTFIRRDGHKLTRGHYSLRFKFRGSLEMLRTAKIYIDEGDGFAESKAIALGFREVDDFTVEATVSLDHGAHALRFDPVNSAGTGNIVLGMGELEFVGLPRTAYYSSLIRDLGQATGSPARLVCELAGTSLLKGPVAGVADLRSRHRNEFGTGVLTVSEEFSYQAWISEEFSYQAWIDAFDTITEADRDAMRETMASFKHRPTISIVMPVYNPPEALLAEAIDSVIDQVYPHWELCIADDLSPDPGVRKVLEAYAARDARIKVVFREQNGHISKASNSAIELATGDWIALMDHDDLIPPHALFCLAAAIDAHPDAMMIYSDEDKIDLNGRRHHAYFKPDWNYHLFLSHNMFSHLGAYRTDMLREIGGFQVGMEGSQDYDLALRSLEKVERSQIIHVPHVLYHWRVMPGSTALSSDEKPYAMIAGERAMTAHFARVGIPGKSELIGHGYRIAIDELEDPPLVSIIIPSRDGGQVLERCIESILSKTDYENYEIVLIDNGSVDRQTLALFEKWKALANVKYIRDDRPFNYSALNNGAVAQCAGEIVAFVNDDIEVHDSNWLTELVKVCLLPGVGSAGPRLWYPDGSLQHAGLILSREHIAMNANKGMARDGYGYFGRGLLMQEFSAMTAACLVMKKSVFNDVGGFDEVNLAVAYNDVDLCLKIREQGLRHILVPDVNLTHHESASRGSDKVGKKKRRLNQEKLYMRENWGHVLDADPAYNPNLTDLNHDFSLAFPPRTTKPWK